MQYKKPKLQSAKSKPNQVTPDLGDGVTPWLILDALENVAIFTLNENDDVSYANQLACKTFQLSFNPIEKHFGRLPTAIHQHIQTEISKLHSEFTLQYAYGSELRTLKSFVIVNTDTKNHAYQKLFYMYDNASQVHTEAKLRQTESILQTLINTSPDYICIKDGNNRWLKANQKLLNLFQIKTDEYAYRSTHELASTIHPVFKAAFEYSEKSDEVTWQTQKPYHNEEIIYLPQGSGKILDVTKIACFSDETIREHLVMYARDVSEHKFIENQLQNRSAILDALISCDWLLHSADSWHTVASAVIQQSCLALRFTRGAILKFLTPNSQENHRAKILYEWSIAGFVNPSRNLESINFNDARLIRWKEILEKGNPVFCEINDLPPDERALLKQHDTTCIAIVPLFVDKIWWGNIVIERCYDSEKTTSQELGSLMAIGRSLSVAIQREHTGKNLNLAEIAFDSASEGIMIMDTNGNIIGINKGFSAITGYSEEETLGGQPLIFQMGKHELWNALSKEGKWSGELTNYRKNGEQYNEWLNITVVKNKDQQTTNYVGVFSDITEIKRSQDKLYELVNHDPLTGLPNRRLLNELFEQAIKRAQREERLIAVLFIDIDRFKSVNDSLGHLAGDKLLYAVSRRIKNTIRDSDVVGRLGGDEFLVIMDALQSTDHAAEKSQKIIHALQSEFLIDDKELFITASIGISIFPQDGIDVDSMIKASDIAMYHVKNKGKNNFCFYSKELSKNVEERFTIENQLRRALERNQFEIYYQPQVSLSNRRIIGAEALIRWNHPELGIVSPAKFIPLAEETGIILHIGEWALTQAAMHAKAWINESSDLRSIAVNVSGVQIMQSNFADTVYGILLETDCDPALLELEITESTVMQNTQHVINTFDQIKNMGVRLAIDDFGTGYSSLSNLKRLPLDTLKIDRSFIQDLPHDVDDAAIASAIYAMACSLGFSVIAEGVETVEQEQFLKQMGCTEAQGYLYSKPVTASEFIALLKAQANIKDGK
ncbi:MAG: EAL domain-containing protein [Methylophilus sp.]|nr:EAL domain-containing protein [Methylophilus sp.]